MSLVRLSRVFLRAASRLPVTLSRDRKMGSNSRLVSVRPGSDVESTLFILGGGSSVDALSDAQWHHIGAAASIGVNYWALHSFRPNFLAIENGGYISASNPHVRIPPPLEVAVQAGTDRRRSQILFHGRPDVQSIGALRMAKEKGIPVRFYPSLPLRAGTPTEIGKDILSILRLNPARWTGLPWALDGWSSISRVSSLALMTGWRNVVLVGVDLQGPYFEQHELFMKKFEHLGQEGFRATPAGRVHQTNDQTRHGLRLMEFLPQLDSQAREIGIGRILSGSDSGPLHRVLESYDW